MTSRTSVTIWIFSSSYENLEKILDALEKTKVRLRANVNTELALELLFLTIREK